MVGFALFDGTNLTWFLFRFSPNAKWSSLSGPALPRAWLRRCSFEWGGRWPTKAVTTPFLGSFGILDRFRSAQGARTRHSKANLGSVCHVTAAPRQLWLYFLFLEIFHLLLVCSGAFQISANSWVLSVDAEWAQKTRMNPSGWAQYVTRALLLMVHHPNALWYVLIYLLLLCPYFLPQDLHVKGQILLFYNTVENL